VSEFVEDLRLGDAEHPKGVPIERLSFKRADDKRTGEPAAHAGLRGAIEITAAAAYRRRCRPAARGAAGD